MGVGERKTVVCITVLLLVLQGACKVEQVKVNLSGMVMSWWQPGEQATVHGVPLHKVFHRFKPNGLHKSVFHRFTPNGPPS